MQEAQHHWKGQRPRSNEWEACRAIASVVRKPIGTTVNAFCEKHRVAEQQEFFE
jgi:hypothetical protein